MKYRYGRHLLSPEFVIIFFIYTATRLDPPTPYKVLRQANMSHTRAPPSPSNSLLTAPSISTSCHYRNLDRRNFSQVEYLSEYMRDFNMTLMQKMEMRRHFNFKLEFHSVSQREAASFFFVPALFWPNVLPFSFTHVKVFSRRAPARILSASLM